jgi:hypothetical protein
MQVLADHVGLPCQLVKGRHYPGPEVEGAVNLIKVDEIRYANWCANRMSMLT